MDSLLVGFLYGFVCGMFVCASVFSVRKIRQELDVRTKTRLARIERKLDSLLTHQGIADPSRPDDPVRAALFAGDKITAIREFRNIHPLPLKDAKAAVEALQHEEGLD